MVSPATKACDPFVAHAQSDECRMIEIEGKTGFRDIFSIYVSKLNSQIDKRSLNARWVEGCDGRAAGWTLSGLQRDT
jgi:hypothetical protein